MEMPTDIMCTATCVTWAGEHVVIAKMDNVGPSILVWDLFANEAAREIRYHHPAGETLSDYTSLSHVSSRSYSPHVYLLHRNVTRRRRYFLERHS